MEILDLTITLASWLALSLLLLSGDVEENPGPPTNIQVYHGVIAEINCDAFVDQGIYLKFKLLKIHLSVIYQLLLGNEIP